MHSPTPAHVLVFATSLAMVGICTGFALVGGSEPITVVTTRTLRVLALFVVYFRWAGVNLAMPARDRNLALAIGSAIAWSVTFLLMGAPGRATATTRGSTPWRFRNDATASGVPSRSGWSRLLEPNRVDAPAARRTPTTFVSRGGWLRSTSPRSPRRRSGRPAARARAPSRRGAPRSPRRGSRPRSRAGSWRRS